MSPHTASLLSLALSHEEFSMTQTLSPIAASRHVVIWAITVRRMSAVLSEYTID